MSVQLRNTRGELRWLQVVSNEGRLLFPKILGIISRYFFNIRDCVRVHQLTWEEFVRVYPDPFVEVDLKVNGIQAFKNTKTGQMITVQGDTQVNSYSRYDF